MQVSDINNLLSSFKKKDDEINYQMSLLLEFTDKYTNDIQNNLKETISMEFVLMRLRIMITSELTMVKGLLSTDGVNAYTTSVLSSFKKRETHLVSLTTRLNEIREDFNSIQKLCYTANVRVNV